LFGIAVPFPIGVAVLVLFRNCDKKCRSLVFSFLPKAAPLFIFLEIPFYFLSAFRRSPLHRSPIGRNCSNFVFLGCQKMALKKQVKFFHFFCSEAFLLPKFVFLPV
jgi:hypothetical protein